MTRLTEADFSLPNGTPPEEPEPSKAVSTSQCGDPIMTAQEHVLDAVLRAQGVLADYIEPGPRDCAQTLTKLYAIFADDRLTNAVNILNLEAVHAAMASDMSKHISASPPRRTSS